MQCMQPASKEVRNRKMGRAETLFIDEYPEQKPIQRREERPERRGSRTDEAGAEFAA